MIFGSIPRVRSHGAGMPLLDMKPLGYDLDYVQALLDSLGPSGREAYLEVQLPLDMIYPFLFALTYCLLLAFFLRRLHWFEGPLFYGCLIPPAAGLADYLENMGIIRLLKSYPDLRPGDVAYTSLCSLIKSGLTTVYFLFLLGILAVLGFRAFKRKYG